MVAPPSARGASLIPGWGARIPHTSPSKNQNLKQKQYCNKFNNDFKKLVHIKISHISKESLMYEYSLAVQWLGLRAFTAKGKGSIPVVGELRILQAMWCSQK